MKLIVQIPAYNEEKTIGKVINEIPRTIEGINEVKVLVIDDGSTDRTVEEATKAGADIIIRNIKNSGLAYSFQKGLNKSIDLGADIVVNTDGDLQYNQKEIPKLIKPILEGKADIVSGNRQVHLLDHMKFAKKYGNILGTKVVGLSSGQKIYDASSGFRVYNKEALLRIFVTSNHTYTHETLIQAANKNLRVIEIPIEFRKRDGDSKLIKSVFSHIKKSSATIIRNTLMYNSLKALTYTGLILIILGIIPLVRWFYLSYLIHSEGSHIQSILLGVITILFGGMAMILGFISDLLAINRKYLEEILYKLKSRSY